MLIPIIENITSLNLHVLWLKLFLWINLTFMPCEYCGTAAAYKDNYLVYIIIRCYCRLSFVPSDPTRLNGSWWCGVLAPSTTCGCFFSLCDAETQFLVGWKSSQKTTKCLHLCNSVSQLGNKLGNKAILLKNASLGIRWGISEFW